MLINNKFHEVDFTLNKLFNKITDLSGQIPNLNANNAIKNSNQQLSIKEDNIANLGSDNTNLNLDYFYKEYKDFRNKIEDEVKSINYKIKLKIKAANNDADIRTDDPMDNNNINTNNVLNSDTFKPIDTTLLNDPNSNINQQFIIASINQLQENDKLVLQNLTYKVSREELEKFQRSMGMEIDRIVCFLK